MTSSSLVATHATGKNSELELLKREIADFDPENDEQFREILRTARELFNMTDGDLAREFLVSRPTISRWLRGRNLPHRAMRRPVIDWILKETGRKLLSRRQQRPTSTRPLVAAVRRS